MTGPTEAKGLHIFVGKYSLPILLFISLFKMDLSAISWAFFLTILVSKSFVFFLTLIGDLVIDHPKV